MREAYFSEKGLCYRSSDFSEGRTTLLFLHGLSGSVSSWTPFEERFEKTHNILTVDMRGHGRSKRSPQYHDYDLTNFADDIAALLKHLGIHTHVLVAHSFGTLVALKLIERGVGTERVMLLGANYAMHRMPRTRFSRPFLAFAVRLLQLLPLPMWKGEHLDYSPLGFSSDWDSRRIFEDIFNTGVRVYLYCLYHIYVFSNDAEWKNITVPTLVMHGSKDSFVPVAHARELAGLLPHAELHIVEGGNHMLVLNNIEEVAEAIQGFAGR